MRECRAIEILLFSTLIALTTCQLQFNKGSNSLTLRVVVPNIASGGARSASSRAMNAKDVAGGAKVALTITQGSTTITSMSSPVTGSGSASSVLFQIPSQELPPGTYQASVQLEDGSGNLLSQTSTSFTVSTPSMTVTLIMPSNLYTVAFVSAFGAQVFSPPFSPTTYIYSQNNTQTPYDFTLTTVDPSATITMTENGLPVIPAAGVYSFDDAASPVTVIMVVTAADGTAPATYTVTLVHIS